MTNNFLRSLPAVATSHDPAALAVARALGKVSASRKVLALIGGTPEDRAAAAGSAPVREPSSELVGRAAYQLDVTRLLADTSPRYGSPDGAMAVVANILHSFRCAQVPSLLVVEHFEMLLVAPSPYIVAFTNLPVNLRVVAGIPAGEREALKHGLRQNPALRGRVHPIEMSDPARVSRLDFG